MQAAKVRKLDFYKLFQKAALWPMALWPYVFFQLYKYISLVLHWVYIQAASTAAAYHLHKLLAVDIGPKVGSIVRHTIEPKATWMAIIIVISVEIIGNTVTEDIRLVAISTRLVQILTTDDWD